MSSASFFLIPKATTHSTPLISLQLPIQTTLINRTHKSDTLGDARSLLIQTHGPSIMRAILSGFAGVAPQSATQNLIELLGTLVTKYPVESWA